MPVLWGYLLRHYFKFFFLSVGTFVALLLVLRSQEIARFTSFNGDPTKVVLFTLYQLPYILPFAIPLSGLISATILTRTLSQTHEWTALRACGASLSTLITPLLLAAFSLALVNFVIVSEVGPYCKLESISLLHKSAQDNPLLMFRKNKFLTIKDTFADLTLVHKEKEAQKFIFAFLDPSSRKISLITAKKLCVDQGMLTGHTVAMISTLESHPEYDDIIIENERAMSMQADQFTSLLKSSHRRVRYEQLPTKLCLMKTLENSTSSSSTNKGLFELYKRAFFTLAPITFILLGSSFGIQIGRQPHHRHLLWIGGLTILLFLSYILGKTLHKNSTLALTAYLLPQVCVWLVSIFSLNKLQQGRE